MPAPGDSPATPASEPRPPLDPSTALVLVVGGSIARDDIPDLCERAHVLLDGCDAAVVVCDVSGLDDPDAVTVDALARLQLTARRLGRRISLLHAGSELQGLLALMGLRNVVPLCAELPLEPGGQPEKREEARGVQEERDPGDPTF